jgi:hypothetical protein
MNSRFTPALSSPTWGAVRRLPLGGLALVGFWALLWALFLGTVAPAGVSGSNLTSREAVVARQVPGPAPAAR